MKLEIPVKVDFDDVQAMIDELKKLQTYKLFEGDDTVLVELDDVISILAKHIMATHNSSESPNGWIPVDINPPEVEKRYLVQTDTEYMCPCRWTNVNHFWTDLTTDWHWHIMDVPQYSKVVAWQPLPDPWKGEEE